MTSVLPILPAATSSGPGAPWWSPPPRRRSGSPPLDADRPARRDKTPMDPAEIDAWLAVAPDGMVTAFFGKPDVGQGVEVAIAQIVAEEMDLPVKRVSVHLADTSLTCDQGGVSGSTGVQRGGAMRRSPPRRAGCWSSGRRTN